MKNSNAIELSVILDVAGNSAPKLESMKEYALMLSKFGYDALYINFEDMLEVEGEPYLGYQRGRYTQDEIKALDEYCSQIGVELRPMISALGHVFNFWKHTGIYAYIMEGQGVLLADEPRTYEFLDKVISACSKCIKSRKINLGMDDAYLVGRLTHLNKHGFIKLSDVYFSHVNKVNEVAKKYGYECEMWADQMVTDYFKNDLPNMTTEQAREMVKGKLDDSILVKYRNFYDTDKATLQNKFEDANKLTDNIGYANVILKGYGFTPDNAFSISAIKAGAQVALEKGVKSFTLQALSTQGGEQSLFVALPSLYFASEILSGRATGLEDLDKEKFSQVVGASFDDFMLLDLPNKPHLDKQYTTFNTKSYFYFYNDPLIGQWDKMLSDNIGKGYAKCADLLSNVKNDKFGYLFKEASALCRFLSIKAELGKEIQKAYDLKDNARLNEIADKVIPNAIVYLDEFFEAFSDKWFKNNKPFGFEVQDQRWGGMTERLTWTARRIKEYTSGKKTFIKEMEQEKLLPDMRMNMPNFHEIKESVGINEDNFILYEWKWTVTVNVTD